MEWRSSHGGGCRWPAGRAQYRARPLLKTFANRTHSHPLFSISLPAALPSPSCVAILSTFFAQPLRISRSFAREASLAHTLTLPNRRSCCCSPLPVGCVSWPPLPRLRRRLCRCRSASSRLAAFAVVAESRRTHRWPCADLRRPRPSQALISLLARSVRSRHLRTRHTTAVATVSARWLQWCSPAATERESVRTKRTWPSLLCSARLFINRLRAASRPQVIGFEVRGGQIEGLFERDATGCWRGDRTAKRSRQPRMIKRECCYSAIRV